MNEVDPAAGAPVPGGPGAPPADPAAGAMPPGGAPPMGGMPGADPMMGGGMGMPPGGMAGPAEPPVIPKHADVWDVLDHLLNKKPLEHDKQMRQQKQTPPANPGPMGGQALMM